MKSLLQIRAVVARLRWQLARTAMRTLSSTNRGIARDLDLEAVVHLIGRSGLFSERWYALAAKSSASRQEMIRHYVVAGEVAGLRPNELFDPTWYRNTYPDIGDASPLVHFIRVGNRQGRRPGPEFDPQDYLARYPDVVAASVDPLRHYLATGRLEGRVAFPGQAPVAPGAWLGSETHPANVANMSRIRHGAEESARIVRAHLPSDARLVVHILHRGGGGTERHIRDLISHSAPDQHPVVIFTSQEPDRLELLTAFGRPGKWDFVCTGLQGARALSSYLSLLKPDRLHLHQASEVMPEVNAALEAANVPFEITVHDYSLICPRNSFVDVRGAYCGEPDVRICQKCISQHPRSRTTDAVAWRTSGLEVLARAERVRCLTDDGATRIKSYQPRARVETIPPVGMPQPRVSRAHPQTPTNRVGVIGTCSVHKGGDFLLRCVEAGVVDNSGLEWILFGSLDGRLVRRARALQKHIYVTGAYAPEKLHHMVSAYCPGLVFFPQHCVETYSYALDEALLTGLPILAPDLGSFPERLHGDRYSAVYSVDAEPAQVVRQIVSAFRARSEPRR